MALAFRCGPAILVCIIATLAGCGGTDSCWGLEVGHTYTFTVRELKPSAQFIPGDPCDPSLPPVVGDSFEFQVVSERHTGRAVDCNAAVGRLQGGRHNLDLAGGVVYSAAIPYPLGSSQVIQASEFIEWNGCRGTWGIVAVGRSADRNPFVAYRPGNPVGVMYRAFYPEAFLTPEAIPSGCGYCVDHFGVEVSK